MLMKESMADVEEGTGEFTSSSGVGSAGSGAAHPRSGMSKAALKKKFVMLLRRKAEVKMEPIFTAAELYTLHEDANMKHSIEDFTAFVESLNIEGYLLKIGPKRYKLVTASS
jgi:DNA helicase MCM8